MWPEPTLKKRLSRSARQEEKLRLVRPSKTQLLIAESRELRERNRELRKDLRGTLDQVRQTLNRSRELTTKIVELSELAERLTNRARAVLALIAGGCSSKEIAARLGIAFKTAACHRTHIMEKLNIHDSASLTRFAVRNGFLRP